VSEIERDIHAHTIYTRTHYLSVYLSLLRARACAFSLSHLNIVHIHVFRVCIVHLFITFPTLGCLFITSQYFSLPHLKIVHIYVFRVDIVHLFITSIIEMSPHYISIFHLITSQYCTHTCISCVYRTHNLPQCHVCFSVFT